MKTINVKRVCLVALWLGPAATLLAQATERKPVTDARPLLIAAIDSPTGMASGILTGDLADAVTRHFHASSPIYIDVSTERRYAQAGCSRLKLTIWQEGVLLPGAVEPRRQTMEIGINYCRDGRPPRSLS
ncbi:MAG: hypothetical protein V4724_20775 [Pseudomonadota bacterium]